MNLKIIDDKNEFLESIIKNNKVMVINKKTFFQFDYKNCTLFSFLDFVEILNNLNFKKGTLFYEYMTFSLKEINIEESDKLLDEIMKIINKLIHNTNIDIDYEIEDDIEKILFNCIKFKYQLDISYIDKIYNKLLEKIILNNLNNIFVIFYDSSLLNLNIGTYDNCYTFDMSLDLNNYNLICNNEVNYFDINYIVDILESVWPIAFNEEKIKNYVIKYFWFKKINLPLQSYDEIEYLVYILLNKIYNYCLPIKNYCIISDNVKSFLAKI